MSFQEDGIKDAIKAAGDLYKDNARISGLLDDKAQKAGGLAGVFLAAAFGFVKTNEVNAFTNVYGRYSGLLLIGSIILFIVCLGTCLSVMWVRGAPLPLGISALRRMLLDISEISAEELTDQVRWKFYLEQVEIWMKILDLQRSLNRVKGKRLLLTQVLLGTGMTLVAILLMGTVIRTYWR
jgi:hypothetical protein